MKYITNARKARGCDWSTGGVLNQLPRVVQLIRMMIATVVKVRRYTVDSRRYDYDIKVV